MVMSAARISPAEEYAAQLKEEIYKDSGNRGLGSDLEQDIPSSLIVDRERATDVG